MSHRIDKEHILKEIGGYFELEHFYGYQPHENAIALNCGRSCLAYLIKAKNIKKIALPVFLCDSIYETCKQYHAEIQYYPIKNNFIPDEFSCDSSTWVYIINYYGQLTDLQLMSLKDKYQNIIVDNTHAYFSSPLERVDTFYTCRKFLGVADGAFLYTDILLDEELPIDQSYNRMAFLLGRFECTASEFYTGHIENDRSFINTSIKRMSKLTQNLLRAMDYKKIETIRTENYCYLDEHLRKLNQLNLRSVKGAFAYPLLVKNATTLRMKLIENKIYVPVLWPNMLTSSNEDSLEHRMARDILPLPCDQRYTIHDMKYICDFILNIRT